MKITSTILFTLSLSAIVWSQSLSTDPCVMVENILSTIELYHYDPREIDDAWSADAFDLWMAELDPNKMIFTKVDMQKIGKYRNQLDDLLISGDCSMIAEVQQIYIEQLNYIVDINQNISYESINIDRLEYMVRDSTRIADRSAMMETWRKYLKYKMYLRAIDLYPDSRDTGLSEVEWQSIYTDIIDRENCRLKSKYNTGDDMALVRESLLRAISLAFDPHTSYLSISETEDFISHINNEIVSFGLDIIENEDKEIEVSAILPGSSAWTAETIEEGDVIVYIKRPDGQVLELSCLQFDDITTWLSDYSNTEAVFTLRHKDGSVEDYELSRGEASMESISGYQIYELEDDGERIIYIALPSFYVDDYGDEYLANGCANDIAKELLTLSREGSIDGLIMDLRFNAGGPILEALRMVGMFINFGTVGVADYRDDEPTILKDPDRGVLYAGPMTVLVNSASASASELFASALQDHRRAVIVGDTTYGKGTIQTILPLWDMRMKEEEMVPIGYINTTIGRFFRPNQYSVQQVGVAPDVYLPDPFEAFRISERYETAALPDMRIDKKTYYRRAAELPISALRESSLQRLARDSTFRELQQIIEAAQGYMEQDTFEISWSNVESYTAQTSGDMDFFETELELPYTISLPTHMERPEMSDFVRELQAENLKSMHMDMYVREAYYITKDLIKQTK